MKNWFNKQKKSGARTANTITTLQNRYTIRAFAGAGAAASVSWGFDTQEQRRIAVKKLLIEPCTAPYEYRFRKICSAMIACVNPNSEQIFDFFLADGVPYIISQWLDDTQLSRLFAEKRPLRMAVIQEICRSVAQYLGDIHTKGYTHLNLNPRNIFLNHTSAATITDLGITYIFSDSGLLLDRHGHAAKPVYFAPEQYMRASVSAASDVFSFGVILFQAITGQMPYHAKTAQEFFDEMAHISPNAFHPRYFNPRTPEYLDSLVARCLAPNPAERPQNGAELLTIINTAQKPANATVRLGALNATSPTLQIPLEYYKHHAPSSHSKKSAR